MTINTSTSAGISQRTEVYAERQMLKHAAPVVVLDKFGLSKQMPKNKGVNIKFRRPKTFTPVTVPLQEGVTPASRTFAYEDVSGTLRQYADLSTITDVIADTHEDPVLNDLSRQMGENIGRSGEALDWAVLRAGTQVIYANGASRSAVNTPVSLAKIRSAVRTLKANKAMQITTALDSSPDYATRAVPASWIAICHTDLENDIRNLPGFLPKEQYGARREVHEREIGAVEEIRFITSPDLDKFEDAGGTAGSMVSTGGSSADVYPMLIVGKEAYGRVALRGEGAISPTIIPVGTRDKSDPLGQRGYVGWKMWHLCLILNDLWMVRIESAATAL